MDLLTEVTTLLERENSVLLYLPVFKSGQDAPTQFPFISSLKISNYDSKVIRIAQAQLVHLILNKPNDPMATFIKRRPHDLVMTEDFLTESGKTLLHQESIKVFMVKRLDGGYFLLKNAWGPAPLFIPYDPTRVKFV